jgi:hypothetical protein
MSQGKYDADHYDPRCDAQSGNYSPMSCLACFAMAKASGMWIIFGLFQHAPIDIQHFQQIEKPSNNC